MASQNREDGIPSGGNQVGRERRDASVCLEISKQQIWLKSVQEMQRGDFPGGPVIGSPPAKAGDTGSIPDPGRSHMLQPILRNYGSPHTESLCSTAREATAVRSLSLVTKTQQSQK